MGWQFTWVSSHRSDFNYDFGVSFSEEEVAKGRLNYNFGPWPFAYEEWPGISVFFKNDANEVFHTYSTYGRGVEVMMGAYNMLDLTPKGRDERDVEHKMEWVRHHDRYEFWAGGEDAAVGGFGRGAVRNLEEQVLRLTLARRRPDMSEAHCGDVLVAPSALKARPSE